MSPTVVPRSTPDPGAPHACHVHPPHPARKCRRDLGRWAASLRTGPRPAPFRAVDGVSLSVSRGRTLGIVDESGCGKSTMARMMVGLLEPTTGTLTINGESIADLARHDRRALNRPVQMVFQDPLGSLNPRKTVREILSAPLGALKDMTGPQARDRGQSQRIGIARAADPTVIVLDEPVSALDVSVQAQVLQLLGDLQTRLGLTYVFISHDLAVVEAIAHDVAVMNRGRIIESAPAERIFAHPQHAYTRLLLASVPRAVTA
ncbi:ATP-binding cassette domain-containing protein [Lichenifustis flavocetrariae]|uniref:ATP-binding cassette domain-containing protein n=1 Tax=Lichenifustis flavocetrariae TaxID=2949735 RepID=UPI003D123357